MDIDERVSVRFEQKEIENIDEFITKFGYPSRSEFFRMAIRNQIMTQQQRNSVAVELAPLLIEHIDVLVARGFYRTREHALQVAIDSYFTEDRIKTTLRAAEGMELSTGKKVEIGVDGTSQRVVSK
jgi:metal-responsive CopG/Arc/MetJ family transcriptional regulator